MLEHGADMCKYTGASAVHQACPGISCLCLPTGLKLDGPCFLVCLQLIRADLVQH
jgi:hypothetical protein